MTLLDSENPATNDLKMNIVKTCFPALSAPEGLEKLRNNVLQSIPEPDKELIKRLSQATQTLNAVAVTAIMKEHERRADLRS